MGALRLYVKCRRAGARGLLFDGYMNRPAPDGWRIITGSTEPLLSAARVLDSQGIGGRLEMWSDGGTAPRLSGDIGRLAKLTISDGGHCPLSFRRWRGPVEGVELSTPEALERIKVEVSSMVLTSEVAA